MTKRKKYHAKTYSVGVDAKTEDILQSLRINQVENVVLSMSAVINQLIREALKARES